MLSLIIALDALRILILTLHLVPLTGADLASGGAHRVELSGVIARATRSWLEQAILATIASREGGFEERVSRCRLRSITGAATAWQLIPFDRAEHEALCQSVDVDAAYALRHVDESRRMCRHLPPPMQLSAYATGECASEEGHRLSIERWPSSETRVSEE